MEVALPRAPVRPEARRGRPGAARPTEQAGAPLAGSTCGWARTPRIKTRVSLRWLAGVSGGELEKGGGAAGDEVAAAGGGREELVGFQAQAVLTGDVRAGGGQQQDGAGGPDLVRDLEQGAALAVEDGGRVAAEDEGLAAAGGGARGLLQEGRGLGEVHHAGGDGDLVAVVDDDGELAVAERLGGLAQLGVLERVAAHDPHSFVGSDERGQLRAWRDDEQHASADASQPTHGGHR